MKIFSFILFFSIVISIAILMIKYFIFSLTQCSEKFNNLKKELKILYTPVFLSFFLFYNKSIEGSFPLTFLSYILYTYFTFLFIFFLYGLFFELFVLIRKFLKNFYSEPLSSSIKRLKFISLFLISFHTIATGYYMAENIQIVNLKIMSSKIEKPLSIVQLSDTHFSQMAGLKFGEKIVKIVKELNPDIVLITGDFLDHGIIEPEKLAAIMNKINVPHGKYAISGNHEFINDFNLSKNFLEKCGFKMIDNEILDLPGNITLSSVADKTGKRFGMKIPSDMDILKKTNRLRYNIFLKHQPALEKNSNLYFDLMLSGHTHAGQIFPFGIFVRMAFKYYSGTYRFDNGSILYVSRGTGTWGPKIRFGSMPEITKIELIPK